jgi:hypothetical protein
MAEFTALEGLQIAISRRLIIMLNDSFSNLRKQPPSLTYIYILTYAESENIILGSSLFKSMALEDVVVNINHHILYASVLMCLCAYVFCLVRSVSYRNQENEGRVWG